MKKLLSKYINYKGDYANRLSNHLPMGLIALGKMGATPERLEEFASDYLKKTQIQEAPASDIKIDEKNWQAYSGKYAHYSSFVDFFAEEWKAKGKEGVLKQYTDLLIPGLAGGGFHGLIRLGYAVEADYDEEIIRALANWANCYQSIDLPETLPVCSDPVVEITKLSNNAYFKKQTYSSSTIASRIEEVSCDPQFQNVICSLPLDTENDLEELASLVLLLYSNGENFTMLHGVTSCHALRLLFPYIINKQRALAYYWNTLLAGYITIGCPEIEITPEDLETPWKKIFTKAMESNDVHVIKFVYTCFEEGVVYPHLPYKYPAARKAGLTLD